MSAIPGYRGRFAPSPTGPLHKGSLLAAVASFLDARHHRGEWLLRIEDIDPPREAPGARDAILASLEAHGLHWDGPVVYQSTRGELYRDALVHLSHHGYLFPCSCTRAVLGPGGTCGERCSPQTGDDTSLRLRLTQPGAFDDVLLGPQTQLAPPSDLVLRRKDGLFAYALAVAVDDGLQGITHVIRGADLLEQTPAQRELLAYLGYDSPAYGHIPVLRNGEGQKLSKQTGAPALDNRQAIANLVEVLALLGISAPDDAQSPRELLLEASRHWNRSAIPSLPTQRAAP